MSQPSGMFVARKITQKLWCIFGHPLYQGYTQQIHTEVQVDTGHSQTHKIDKHTLGNIGTKHRHTERNIRQSDKQHHWPK